jgi:hypothetical protein
VSIPTRLTRQFGFIGGCGFAADPDSDSVENPVFWDISIDTVYVFLQHSTGPPVVNHLALNLATTRGGSEGFFAVIGEKKHRMPVLLPLNKEAECALVVAIPVTPDAQNRLVSATRFLGLLRGKPLADPRITAQRRSRLRQILRASDALCCGASHRDIAEALFGKHRISGPDWHESSLRYAIIRLIRDGKVLVEGGYRELLKHRESH